MLCLNLKRLKQDPVQQNFISVAFALTFDFILYLS